MKETETLDFKNAIIIILATIVVFFVLRELFQNDNRQLDVEEKEEIAWDYITENPDEFEEYFYRYFDENAIMYTEDYCGYNYQLGYEDGYADGCYGGVN